MKLSKSLSGMMVPLMLVALPMGFFLLHKALEFMTLPTSAGIERRIKTELPKGTDKAKVLDFLKDQKFSYGDFQKVTAQNKFLSDYQEKNIKSQIDLIEYDVGGWKWTAGWGFWCTYIKVRFYFNRDEKLVDYTLREFKESI
ncbi:MAG TPA: hypothetical protein VJ810_14680 [Blastocatellia bacterium]|nr:hypothetical protein [Blastocatellia bacterium]